MQKISLYYSEGSSDKEYHAQLEASGTGFVVNFQYGRRGSALTADTKTAEPVDIAKAEKIYQKLVLEKKGKGYTEEVSGEVFVGTDKAGDVSGLVPQLLNSITREQAIALLADDDWVMEEKMDGHRRMADGAKGINKKGLFVPLPATLEADLASLGNVQVDGEQIKNTLWLFDILSVGSRSLTALGAVARYAELKKLVPADTTSLKVVPMCVTTAEKQKAFAEIETRKGEGVVFKKKDASYVPGRPASGGNQLKFKFKESATVEVVAVSATKRSVSYQVYADGVPVPRGKVTIPPNVPVPKVGTIIEVEYLYAYPKGALYQPVYLGERIDQDLSDCKDSQLKFKPEDTEEDDEF